MSLLIFQLALLVLSLEAPADPTTPQSVSEPPKSTLIVSLARQTIRENDCIPVEVWFYNDGKQEITGASLRIASPDFFMWSVSSCEVKDADTIQSISLEPAASGESTLSNSIRWRKLYLKTGSNIEVGDYALLFTLQCRWKEDGQNKQSLVATEKSIKANFLGSESVAGVPLGLAGLIVPGLFFWIVLRGLGVSWSAETALGDKLIYSVVVSFIFVALASALLPYASWLHYLDVSSGMSIRKLILLAVTGIGVGVVTSFFDYLRRRGLQKRAADYEIGFSDDSTAIIGKLLRKNSTYNPSRLVRLVRKRQNFAGYKPQTMVKLITGEVYVGSLGEKGKDITVLAGRFKVVHGNTNAELQNLSANGLLRDVFLRKGDLLIADHEAVKTINNGVRRAAGGFVMTWPSSQVLQVVLEPGKGDDEALILGQ